MVSVDPSRVHDVGFHVAWHGRFMTLAWGFLVPLGVVIARYYKVRRLAFEIIHKTAGYIALLLAFVAVLTGIWEANGPRWMWISLIAWWCSLLLFSLRQERTRRCPDTYQALWGPDPIHPGNKKKKRSRARH